MTTPNPRPRKLPRDPSVEHLRKQAKTLFKAYERRLGPARQRVAAVFQDKLIKLTDAQHVIAVEYGFPSWRKLTDHVESIPQQPASWMRDTDDNLPKAANDADLSRVHALLDRGGFSQRDLNLALGRACCNMRGKRENDYRACAEALYQAGADPNGGPGKTYGHPLMGSCEFRNPIGMRFLLEHGADAIGSLEPPTEDSIHNNPMRMLLATYGRGNVHLKHEGIALLEQYGATRPPEVDEVAYAIFRNDAEELSRLLDAEPKRIAKRFKDFTYGNINLEGATYLHQAVEFEAIQCVDVLCQRGYEHGIHINAKADVIDGLGGQTPIFHCIASNSGGNFPMLEHLVAKYGLWIDFTARATIRMYCWKTSREETLRNVTPLEMAEANTHPDLTKLYWKTQERELAILRERDVRSKMEKAVANGDEAGAIRLMDAHPEHVGPHLWPAAVHQAQSVVLTTQLLDRGVDPNQCSAPRKPLHLAASKGNVELVKLLLDRGADPDVVDGEHITPIELAAGAVSNDKSPNWEAIATLLRDAGATVTPFTEMLLGNDDAAIEAFENDPSLLNQTGWQHFPPLICAARAGRPRVIEKLLALGADPDQTDKLDSTPLWFACQAMTDDPTRQSQLIQHLVDAGADVNRICEEGTTALHFAVWRGHVPIVEALADAGADASIKDDEGLTPADWIDRSQQPENAPHLQDLLASPGSRPPNDDT